MDGALSDRDADRIVACLADRWWRLNNLYWIKDRYGRKVLFKPNAVQAALDDDLHTLNLVLKSRQHGITTLSIRLGWCPRDIGQVNEIRESELAQDVYLSPGDAGRFFSAAVSSPNLPPNAVVYVTSRHLHRLQYDLSDTTKLTGWTPTESWPIGATDW